MKQQVEEIVRKIEYYIDIGKIPAHQTDRQKAQEKANAYARDYFELTGERYRKGESEK